MDSSDFEETFGFLYDFIMFMTFLKKLHTCRTGHQRLIEFLRNDLCFRTAVTLASKSSYKQKFHQNLLKISHFRAKLGSKMALVLIFEHTHFGPPRVHFWSNFKNNYIALLRRLRAFTRATICAVLV